MAIPVLVARAVQRIISGIPRFLAAAVNLVTVTITQTCADLEIAIPIRVVACSVCTIPMERIVRSVRQTFTAMRSCKIVKVAIATPWVPTATLALVIIEVDSVLAYRTLSVSFAIPARRITGGSPADRAAILASVTRLEAFLIGLCTNCEVLLQPNNQLTFT